MMLCLWLLLLFCHGGVLGIAALPPPLPSLLPEPLVLPPLPPPPPAEQQSRNGYIVKLKRGISSHDFLEQSQSLQADERPDIKHVYNTTDFQGFAAQLSPDELEELKNDFYVDYVEQETPVRLAVVQPNAPGWGLPRICRRERILDRSRPHPYVYEDAGGAGVDIFVIDTGVNDKLAEFGGRARHLGSFVPGEPNTDIQGHGTLVAGVVGANTYGVAKRARIYGLKVMDKNGDGTSSAVVAAIQYVTSVARPGKTIINLSVTSGRSRAIDDATEAAVRAGVVVIVAAGNERTNACEESPPAAPHAFAVAASDGDDRHAAYSNYGPCVRMYAPGSDIRSLGLDGRVAVQSGTSMAAPFVAGTAAIFMSMYSFKDAGGVYAMLLNRATRNALTGVRRDTPNRLVYSLSK
ncbi:alkaline serine protease [Syncephalis pseudoplumigaleata]|uniref:Alkaline serine protease n=1 Tax=Syncephalis pseudoplumigaleata TaxID=1712513 RepID=A0A4P9YZC4_9FUNG|nr:alkaline serine protease [Syncephalis pseudoplumigaleata]|eukprot:RKP24380.1 alkaline serine protease [Syncephalis pseudoplumigaleata]